MQEIEKRPFGRPLFFWIAGICLQTCFPLQTVSFIIPALVAVILSLVRPKRDNNRWLYHARWVWGALFAGIVVFLAIQMTYLTEWRMQHPSEPGVFLRKAQEVQAGMVERLNDLNLPDANKSVLATLTVNDRRAMTAVLHRQFSVTGVSHLLAVSGFHVGIVCSFVNLLLSFIPKRSVFFRWLKYLVAMLCVWAFTFVSGLTTASVRAAVMLTIYMTGWALGRHSDRYNTLAGAAFCMLVYNPFYLFDVGFQLSYIAVFFILYLQPCFRQLIKIRNPLIAAPWNVLTLTMAAQIGTSFLCFYYFGQSSLVFLFTNLFLSLLATVLIPVTLLWMLIPAWIPGIEWLRIGVETMSRWMMGVVERFAALPGATLSLRFDFITLLLSYLCLAFGLLYVRRRRYRMLFAGLTTLLIILCWQLFQSL